MNRNLLALATILHLLPHPFGVSPVGATALYAGAYASRRNAWLVPLAPLFIGHLVYGFYDPTVMAFVYAGFALSTIAGRILSVTQSARNFAIAVVASAIVFYVVSNFAIWFVGMYPPTVTGLAQCYVNGLPYLGTGILANAAYGILFFCLHAQIVKREPEPVLT